MATGVRRVWGFLGLWALAAGSIVVASTSPPPSGTVDGIVQSVGQFYLSGVSTLYQFGEQAAPPEFVMNVIYAVVAVVTWGVGGTILDGYGFPSIDGDVAVSVFGLAVMVGILVVVFGYGPQFLMLAVVGVGISVVAALVP